MTPKELEKTERLPFKPDDKPPEPQSILRVISDLARNPQMDPEQVSKWLELYERLDARDRQRQYSAALAELEERLPQIEKHGAITLPSKKTGEIHKPKYALLEDIDLSLRPLMAEYGFALQFNNPVRQGEWFTISGTLSHRAGHSKDFQLDFPMDRGPGRNEIQACSSTFAYARRQLIKLIFNIIEKGEDRDGAGMPITAEQAKDLESAVTEVGGSPERFLNTMGVESFERIPMSRLGEALMLIEQRRGAAK